MVETHERKGRSEIEELDALGREIARISSHVDAALHRLLTCIRRFDAAEAWYMQGALSCAHWLTWRIGIGPNAAREYVRVARALADLPRIDAALGRGEISYSKVRALTRVATPENEDELLKLAFDCTGAQLEKILASHRRVLRLNGELPVDAPEFRYVRQRSTASGMVQVTAQVSPEEAAIVMRALEVARERATEARGATDVSAETSEDELAPTFDEKQRIAADRADGLLWMAETLLSNRSDAGAQTSPVEVMVHVDARDSDPGAPKEARLEDGRRLEPETTARLLCDTAVVPVVEDAHGTPLDVGRRTRTIPSSLRRALRARDRGCRFPGCPHRRTDGHHIVPWSEGGPTSLANLVSVCRRHHRFVHELGWRVELRAENEVLFVAPPGCPSIDEPIRTPPGDDPVARLSDELASRGISIDHETGATRADGRIDHAYAVEALFDLCRTESEGAVSAETSAAATTA